MATTENSALSISRADVASTPRATRSARFLSLLPTMPPLHHAVRAHWAGSLSKDGKPADDGQLQGSGARSMRIVAMLTPGTGQPRGDRGQRRQAMRRASPTTRPSGGIRALIVAPLTTPPGQGGRRPRDFGAEVLLHGANYYDEAFAEATAPMRPAGTHIHPSLRRSRRHGRPGNHRAPNSWSKSPATRRQWSCSIGGGGLIGGIACAIKESRPEIRTRWRPDCQATLHGGSRRGASSGHDRSRHHHRGRHCRGAAPAIWPTLPVVERYVDEIVMVDAEDEIASAILMLLEREKTLAEALDASSAWRPSLR